MMLGACSRHVAVCYRLLPCPLVAQHVMGVQEWLVTGASMCEQQRLMFLRFHQAQLRIHSLREVQDAVQRGDDDAAGVGQRIILPASYTGGPRYMFHRCQVRSAPAALAASG